MQLNSILTTQFQKKANKRALFSNERDELCHLPLPYTDELLYSDIARYLIRIGSCNSLNAAEDIFGRIIRPHIDLPCSLNTVAERTQMIWQMSGEDIAYRLTLFPYYSSFVPIERVRRCLRVLLSNDGEGIHASLGINACRVKIPMVLRFCKTCRQSDIEKYGEAFWHRSHQLAGVLVCPQHSEPLINTTISMRPKIRSLYADAMESTSSVRTDYDFKLREQEMEIAAKIAIRCQEILFGQFLHWDIQDIHFKYKRAAIARGFYKGVSFFMPSELKKAFLSFYGHDLLLRMGCDIDVDRRDWIDNIFNKPRRLFHPALHALIQVFLESIAPIQSDNPFGPGPWRCPNAYADHDDPFPIKKVELISRGGGKMVASAKCSCGFKFTFLRVSDTDQHLPVINRRLASSPTWIAELKRLKEGGFGISEIASKMEIDRKTVRRILNKKSTRNQPREPSRIKIISTSRSRNHKIRQKFNWARRDTEWSRLLRSAAISIRNEDPCRRATQSALIEKAGISRSIYSYLTRLPECRAALEELTESMQSFIERRTKQWDM